LANYRVWPLYHYYDQIWAKTLQNLLNFGSFNIPEIYLKDQETYFDPPCKLLRAYLPCEVYNMKDTKNMKKMKKLKCARDI